MPFTYTFPNGAVMHDWDVTVLQTQSAANRRAAYTARWGTPAACPALNTACPEERLRRFCWPHKTNGEVRQGTIAKCYSCRRTNAPMPVGTANIPVGRDDDDLLPCGCEWKLVAVELLVKYRVNALAIYDHNNNIIGNNLCPGTLNTAHRTMLWETLDFLQGGNLSALDLVDGSRRVSATHNALANGSDI